MVTVSEKKHVNGAPAAMCVAGNIDAVPEPKFD